MKRSGSYARATASADGGVAADAADTAQRTAFAGIPALERLEIELLLEGIHRHYGYDFRSYAFSSLRRRLKKRLDAEGLSSFSQLQDRVLHDPTVMEALLRDVSVNVTGMFRDPTFFLAFRKKIIPLLRT